VNEFGSPHIVRATSGERTLEGRGARCTSGRADGNFRHTEFGACRFGDLRGEGDLGASRREELPAVVDVGGCCGGGEDRVPGLGGRSGCCSSGDDRVPVLGGRVGVETLLLEELLAVLDSKSSSDSGME
jgi:hypothetical protein